MNGSTREDGPYSSNDLNSSTGLKKFLYSGILGSVITSISYLAALTYYLLALPIGYFDVNGYMFHFSFVYGLFIPFSTPLLSAGYYGLSRKYHQEILTIAAGIMTLAFVLSIYGTAVLIAWFNVPAFASMHFPALYIIVVNSILIGVGFHKVHAQSFNPRVVRIYALLLIGWNTIFLFMQFYNFITLYNLGLILFIVIHHSLNIILGILSVYIFRGESRTLS
ncbi:MAG: hypothetical protein AM326_05320 [Candidatus Thorarchaeota archaeon SMTZ-45]|nr:MAG: hypothetical protein AM326_05320 [Candidatus Thorarchaeota archaeon SMTZ-45]